MCAFVLVGAFTLMLSRRCDYALVRWMDYIPSCLLTPLATWLLVSLLLVISGWTGVVWGCSIFGMCCRHISRNLMGEPV